MKTSEDFAVGQRVRCRNPEGFLQPLRAKLRNRLGVVERVTPAKAPDQRYAGLTNRVEVRWLTREGRGKEFLEWMQPRDIE